MAYHFLTFFNFFILSVEVIDLGWYFGDNVCFEFFFELKDDR